MWASFEVVWFGSLEIGSICLEAPESGAIAIFGGVDADVEVTIGAIRFIITLPGALKPDDDKESGA